MPRIRISPWAPAVLCALWHLFPPRAVIGFLLAAICHELGHAVALYALGGTAEAISVTPRGIFLTPSPLPYPQEAICALSGPAVSVLLMLLWDILPWAAFWGSVHAFFNLLPVLPMDGGRFLHALMQSVLPAPRAEEAYRHLSFLFLLPLLTLGVFLILRLHLVKIALAASILLAAKRFLLKNPTFRATIKRV